MRKSRFSEVKIVAERKLLRPAQRKAAVQTVRDRPEVQERPACRWLR